MTVGAQHRSRAVLGRRAPFELGDRLLFVRTEDRQAGEHYCLNGPWSLVTMDEGRKDRGTERSTLGTATDPEPSLISDKARQPAAHSGRGKIGRASCRERV